VRRVRVRVRVRGTRMMGMMGDSSYDGGIRQEGGGREGLTD